MALLVFAAAAVLLFAFITWRQFYPSNRTELTCPINGINHRIFAEDRSFQDISILIVASDWPHTFSKPFIIGSAYLPGRYEVNQFFWSTDGSLVVQKARRKGEAETLYQAAYDYQNHRGINRSTPLMTPSDRDKEIQTLLKTRGGLGPQILGIPDSKDY